MKEGKTLKMDNDIIVSLMSVITFADFSVRKLRVVCVSDRQSLRMYKLDTIIHFEMQCIQVT